MATARETGPELITKPGSKSVLWGYFGLEINCLMANFSVTWSASD